MNSGLKVNEKKKKKCECPSTVVSVDHDSNGIMLDIIALKITVSGVTVLTNVEIIK